MDSINSRLKDLRYQNNKEKLTQKDVAKMLDIPQSSISNYEKENYPITHDIIIKYCRGFNVTSDYLLGLSDNYEKTTEEDNLYISETALAKLKKEPENTYLLSKLIESELYDEIITDCFIYAEGLLDQACSGYVQFVQLTEAQFKSNLKEYSESDPALKTFEYAKTAQYDYFANLIARKICTFISEYRKQNGSDKELQLLSSQYQNMYNVGNSHKGTASQKVAASILSGLGLPIVNMNNQNINLSTDSLLNLTHILEQSKLVTTNESTLRNNVQKNNKQTNMK